eukprot:7180093-Pyramimonas_sp.AAC.1
MSRRTRGRSDSELCTHILWPEVANILPNVITYTALISACEVGPPNHIGFSAPCCLRRDSIEEEEVRGGMTLH